VLPVCELKNEVTDKHFS